MTTLTVAEDGSVAGRYNISGTDLSFTIAMDGSRIDITGDEHTVEVAMDATVLTRANIRWIGTPITGILNEFSCWRQLGVGLAFVKQVSGNNPSLTRSVPDELTTTTALPTDLDAFSNNFVPIFGNSTYLYSANGVTPNIYRYKISDGTTVCNDTGITGAHSNYLAKCISVVDDLAYVVALDGGNIKLYTVDFADAGATTLLKTISPSSFTFDRVRIAIGTVDGANIMAIYGYGHVGYVYTFFHYLYDIAADDLSAITYTDPPHSVADIAELGFCGVMLSDRLIVVIGGVYSYPNYYQSVIDINIETNGVVTTEIGTSMGNTGIPVPIICSDAVYIAGTVQSGGVKTKFYKYTLSSQTASEVLTSITDYPTGKPNTLVGSGAVCFALVKDNATDWQVWDMNSNLLTTIEIPAGTTESEVNRLVIDDRIWISFNKGDVTGYLYNDASDAVTLTSPDPTGLSFYWIGDGYTIRTDYTTLESYIER
jgi:hypothetical protein